MFGLPRVACVLLSEPRHGEREGGGGGAVALPRACRVLLFLALGTETQCCTTLF